MDRFEKIILLTENWHDQTAQLRQCNAQLEAVRQWKVLILEEYKDEDITVKEGKVTKPRNAR